MRGLQICAAGGVAVRSCWSADCAAFKAGCALWGVWLRTGWRGSGPSRGCLRWWSRWVRCWFLGAWSVLVLLARALGIRPLGWVFGGREGFAWARGGVQAAGGSVPRAGRLLGSAAGGLRPRVPLDQGVAASWGLGVPAEGTARCRPVISPALFRGRPGGIGYSDGISSAVSLGGVAPGEPESVRDGCHVLE